MLAGAGAILPGYSLPWHLSDQYPAVSATAVPTNTSILLRIDRAAIEGSYPGIQYTLKTQAGTSAPLKNACVYFTDVSVPAAELLPSTRYTFTIAPASTVGDPYSFDFVTGPGPDTVPPQMTGFDPPSGTAGTGISGPFTVLFNKRLLSTAVLSGQAVMLKPAYQAGLSMTADGKGIVVRPQPYSSNTWPAFYQLSVDPAKVQDASGNPGQGPSQSSQYTTFAAPDASGPALKGFFPADGDTGVPLNGSIRLLFSQAMDTNSARAEGAGAAGPGVVLDGNGAAVAVRVNSFANGYGVELKPQNMLSANQVYRVRIVSGLTSQAGAPAAPATFQFTTGTDPDLAPAQALAVGPDFGSAMPANVLVALRANKRIMPLAAVEYSTVGSPAANGGGNVTGSASISADGQTFSFTPQAWAGPWPSVSLLDVVDVTGASFTTAVQSLTPGPAADADPPALVALNPSARAIDVRFDGPAGAQACRGYLHRGGTRVPAACTVTAADQIRVTPVAPLAAGAEYRLVVDAAQEIAFRVEAPGTGEESPVDSVRFDASGDIMVRFRGRVNPLTVSRGLRLTGAAGECVRFTMQRSLDGSAIRIVPERQAAGITVTIDSVESHAGARLAPGRFER